MTERLLQYIWQFQYFNATALQTSTGLVVEVVHPGQWNSHQGPDFSAARVRIGDQLWVGNVELHLLASDWKRHAHHVDERYRRVILHVVWRDDDPVLSAQIPTVVLEGRISGLLLQQYESWMKSAAFIPCAQSIGRVHSLVWTAWSERLVLERLQRKGRWVTELLQRNSGHWEETMWWVLARSFGLPVNADAFQALAESLPFRLILRHRRQIHQLEALLLGQAGLLTNAYDDHYFRMLEREYTFYAAKYRLRIIDQPVQFLRMRPSAFPTVRLAQLANLLHESGNMWSSFRGAQTVDDLRSLLRATANDYWHYHYTFQRDTTYQPKILGAQMIDGIIVNAIVPLIFAYGHATQQERMVERSLSWLSAMRAENNAITRRFAALGIEMRSAAESQALSELKTQYCERLRCLDCAVGVALLKGM